MKTKIQAYEQYVRPELARVLNVLKMDLHYHRAEGDCLSYSKDGKDQTVADFLGGFGSTILGHNHPRILETMKQCMEMKLPQHAQGSLRVETAYLGEKLNSLVKASLQDEREFVMTLANTGTEAVEVALKHALLEWKDKRDHLILKIKTLLARTQKVSPALRQDAENFIDKLNCMRPMMLTLSKSFHGKTSGAVSLSSNEAYKKMFLVPAVGVSFLDVDNLPLALSTISSADLVLEFGQQKISFNQIVGFIYEPIQGEGGIFEIPEKFITSLVTELKFRSIPVIADEIQSGLFRTGRFLCSEWFNIKPDYVLLGKSLGGGIAKISACMIARNHYVDEFGWLQTSTFAEDDWSSKIALEALNLLESSQPEIAQKAQQFEDQVRKQIIEIQKKFPGVITRLRGRGFFLGIEFNFNDHAPLTDILMCFYEHGNTTYLYTSYLLHNHHVRVGVTLSAPEVIRLEPSAFVTEESVHSLLLGLMDLCEVIYQRKTLKLTAHLWDQVFTSEQLATVSEPRSVLIESRSSVGQVKDVHIGFLTHMVTPAHAQTVDAGFRHVHHQQLDKFFKNYANHAVPFRYYQQRIKGTDGSEVVLNLYGIMQPSSYFEASLRAQDFKSAKVVQECMDLAAEHEMKYFGLGAFTSIVTENGMLLTTPKVPITTGNSLTAGMTTLAVKRIAKEKNIDLAQATIGVVGFAGNICNVLTQVMADDTTNFVLISRESLDSNPKYQDAINTLLSETNLKREHLKISHDLMDLQSCDIVIIGTNSSVEIIKTEHIRENAIVLDISLPSNVESAVKKRKDVSYLQTGLAVLPYNTMVDHSWMPLRTGDTFACLAETVIMGLHQIDKSYSLGRISKAQVRETLAMAEKVGVTLGGFSHRY